MKHWFEFYIFDKVVKVSPEDLARYLMYEDNSAVLGLLEGFFKFENRVGAKELVLQVREWADHLIKECEWDDE